jgi:hypothetical protein
MTEREGQQSGDGALLDTLVSPGKPLADDQGN